jgi:hypothetical protein
VITWLPVLLILGYHFSENKVWRAVCGVLLLAWFAWLTIPPILHERYELLIVPGIMLLIWFGVSAAAGYAKKWKV